MHATTNRYPGSSSILIVDDDFDVLFTLSSYLKEAGYRISSFDRPEEAISAIESTPFDVVVSDIKMPHLTGLDILDAVRKHAPDTPLIFMTAYADLDTAINAIKKGAFDFLIKPLDYELVGLALEKACAMARGRRLEQEYLSQLEEGVLKKTAELRNTLSQLAMAHDAARGASVAKSELLATTGQGLAGLLQTIVDRHQQLEASGLSPAQQEMLHAANSATATLQEMVTRMRTYADQCPPRPEGSRERFSLRELTLETLHLLRSQAESKGMTFRTGITQDVPDSLRGDAIAFGQVLENLVAHAVQFSANGDIDVRIEQRELTDSTMTLQVSVSPSCMEIPADRLKEFIREFSSGSASVAIQGNTLTMAQRLEACLHGTIWLEDIPENGTRFCFTASFLVV